MLLVLLAVLSSDPADFVRHLYSTKGGEAPDRVYGVYSRKALTETFEGPIVDLIWRDLVDAMGEVGRMDGHYLYDAQDDEITNLQVKTLENDGERARVLATFEFDKPRAVEFHLRKTSDGWRISNIVYAGGASYMSYLQTDFPLPTVEDERTGKATCRMFAEYDVTAPEGLDAKEDAVVLAEMFANGTGVEQDFSAAIHLLCGANIADAELWSMIQHVLHMERGANSDPLDFCDHSTSRMGGIICASRRQHEDGPAFEQRYEAVRAEAGQSGKALDALREAADAFIAADANWETEQMREGTAYAYAETHATLDRQEQFLALLEQYSTERAPAASSAAVTRADRALNAAYRKRIAAIEPCNREYQSCDDSLPTETENLRAAQRAWIRYRDAWIAYYQAQWRGNAPADTLRREIAARVTAARTEELEP